MQLGLRTTYLFGLVCWLAWTVQAQDVLLGSDYVILTNGRRLDGSITRVLGERNFERIQFLRRGETTTYQPGDITGFGLGSGEYFQSFSLEGLSTEVFAQLIIQGPLNLVRYQESFYAGPADGLMLLSKDAPLATDIQRASKKKVAYIATLNSLMAGPCEDKISSLIQRTKLTEDDLVWLFNRFFECDKTKFTYYGKLVPAYILSPVASMTVFGSGVKTKQLRGERSDTFQVPIAGQGYVGMRLHSLRKSPKVGLELGLAYDYSGFQVDAQLVAGLGRFTATEEMSVAMVSIPISWQYTFSRLKSKRYLLQVGPGFGKTFTNSTFAIQDVYYSNFPYTTLKEGSFTQVKPGVIYVHGAIGIETNLGEKSRLNFLLKARYLPQFYEIAINSNVSLYHRLDAGLGISYLF